MSIIKSGHSENLTCNSEMSSTSALQGNKRIHFVLCYILFDSENTLAVQETGIELGHVVCT